VVFLIYNGPYSSWKFQIFSALDNIISNKGCISGGCTVLNFGNYKQTFCDFADKAVESTDILRHYYQQILLSTNSYSNIVVQL